MKHTLLLSGVALAASLAFAHPASAATITYFADDNLNFDVLIEAVGDVGIQGETSPSGFWSFLYQVEDVGGFPNVAEIHTEVNRELPAMGGFIRPLFGAPTIRAFDELPAMGSDAVDGDTIHALFTLHSGVALEDWEWSLRLTREGTHTSVPDGASTLALFGLATLAMSASQVLRWRARWRKGGELRTSH